jgi:hypothetical protein
VPRWCSSSHRHRAWGALRAAESGRAAVEVVGRMVEFDRQVPLVEQALVSPARAGVPAGVGRSGRRAGHRPRVWDVTVLADKLGRALTALDQRPGGDDTTAGIRLKLSCPAGIRLPCCPGPWSTFSPQKVRKKSAKSPQDVHKR